MTPGLAFFYGGLVRRKNVLAIMMQSFISMGVVTAIWVLFGYSLAFSGDIGGLIGNLHWSAQRRRRSSGPWAPTIPALALFGYQEMFAIITPALITGAFADRVTFKGYLRFLVVWSILVYIPFAHWIWGGGFLAQQGVLDFAGGIVVHMSAGFAALASVFVVGGASSARASTACRTTSPSSRWAPACCGSAGSASTAAARWPPTASPRWRSSTPTSPGRSRCAPGSRSPGCTRGSRARRRADRRGRRARPVTPCAGYVPPWAASSSACWRGRLLRRRHVREKHKWDDALDVWAVHGVGGILGTILGGVFAVKAVNPQGADGLIDGDWKFFGWQVARPRPSRGLRVRRHLRHPEGHQLLQPGARARRRRGEGLDDPVRRDRVRPSVRCGTPVQRATIAGSAV